MATRRASEAHHYHSPDASAPYEITSRYEWGVDHLHGKEVYPAHTDRGTAPPGDPPNSPKLEPANLGVLLRRKLDFAFPDQRAEVFVADASHGQEAKARTGSRPESGIWPAPVPVFIPIPKEELGATQHWCRLPTGGSGTTSFSFPRALTAGRSAIRVRVRFTPVKRPLFPGHPLADLAWSEIRYSAYCFVMPAAAMPAVPGAGRRADASLHVRFDQDSVESTRNQSQLLHRRQRQGDLLDRFAYLEQPARLGNERFDPAF